TLTSVSDVAASITALKSFNGKGLLENMSELGSNYLEGFSNSKDRLRAARILGVAIDDSIGGVYEKWGATDHITGNLAKAQNLFFKMTLLPQHTNSARVA